MLLQLSIRGTENTPKLVNSDFLSLFIFFEVFLKKFNIYLFLRDRERQSMSRGGADRGEDTKQAPGSELSAQSLKWGLNSQTMRS